MWRRQDRDDDNLTSPESVRPRDDRTSPPSLYGPDDDSFEKFVAEHYEGFIRYAYRHYRDRGAAPDLVQEALARTYPQWESACVSPHGYVRRVIANLAIDWIRAASVRPRLVELETRHDPGHTMPEPHGDEEIIAAAIADLPPGQRAVIILRHFDDLSIEQTAAALGCSEGTVKSQEHRARRTLAEVLDHLGQSRRRDPGTGDEGRQA